MPKSGRPTHYFEMETCGSAFASNGEQIYPACSLSTKQEDLESQT